MTSPRVVHPCESLSAYAVGLLAAVSNLSCPLTILPQPRVI